jgi:hypothetical protein
MIWQVLCLVFIVFVIDKLFYEIRGLFWFCYFFRVFRAVRGLIRKTGTITL